MHGQQNIKNMYPFCKKTSFYGEEFLAPLWRTAPCRLSATVYSRYSRIPSIVEAVPQSAT